VLEGVDGIEGVFDGDQAGVDVATRTGIVESHEKNIFDLILVRATKKDEKREGVILWCVSKRCGWVC